MLYFFPTHPVHTEGIREFSSDKYNSLAVWSTLKLKKKKKSGGYMKANFPEYSSFSFQIHNVHIRLHLHNLRCHCIHVQNLQTYCDSTIKNKNLLPTLNIQCYLTTIVKIGID